MYIFLVDNATMVTISTIATPSMDAIISISQSINFETRSKVVLKLKVLALAYIACMPRHMKCASCQYPQCNKNWIPTKFNYCVTVYY